MEIISQQNLISEEKVNQLISALVERVNDLADKLHLVDELAAEVHRLGEVYKKEILMINLKN
jgi:hypothetical protein